MRSQFLFVYGTLLQPGNHFADYLASHCSFIIDGKLKGILYDIVDYPGLIIDDDAGYVFGVVYKIDQPTVLQELDIYEGVGDDDEQPNLYLRQLHKIETQKGKISAWVYIYNRTVAGYTPIQSGNYIQFSEQKKSPDS